MRQIGNFPNDFTYIHFPFIDQSIFSIYFFNLEQRFCKLQPIYVEIHQLCIIQLRLFKYLIQQLLFCNQCIFHDCVIHLRQMIFQQTFLNVCSISSCTDIALLAQSKGKLYLSLLMRTLLRSNYKLIKIYEQSFQQAQIQEVLQVDDYSKYLHYQLVMKKQFDLQPQSHQPAFYGYKHNRQQHNQQLQRQQSQHLQQLLQLITQQQLPQLRRQKQQLLMLQTKKYYLQQLLPFLILSNLQLLILPLLQLLLLSPLLLHYYLIGFPYLTKNNILYLISIKFQKSQKIISHIKFYLVIIIIIIIFIFILSQSMDAIGKI